MNDTISKLLDAKTVEDVVAFLRSLREEGVKSKWLPVGGVDNNLATIGLGRDPAAGLVERITNGLDAVIDREWQERGTPPNVLSPRDASEEWFDIPSGKMSNIKKEQIKKYSDLAKKVVITLHDSSVSSSPTVDIRDRGTGIKASEFSESILGLNKNRKLRKLFLAGAFGQGGSTALAYSQWTIIASKETSESGGNKLALTLVGFDAGDPNVDKHGYYKYLVNPKTGHPFEIEVEGDDFEEGTLVRHISMDLGKYRSIFTSPTNSLWYLVHNYLFDPVLPFTISDLRQSTQKALKSGGTSRTVLGNTRRLSQGENTEYQNSASLSFRDGEVSIHWWVLNSDGSNARDRITNYTLASKPIIVTFNGQKQGEYPNTIIKNDLKLPFLDRYLIVQVDCDRLDSDARRQLFPTTRESIRETAIGDDLRRLITETLSGDEELIRLDRERKKKLVNKVESSAVETIRKRLSNRVKVFTTGSFGGKGTTVIQPPPGDPISKREPIPVQDPPSFLTITNSAPRKVYAGKSFTLKFETDAHPDYFDGPDSFIAVTNPATYAQYTGTTRLNKGYGVAYFQASSELDVGETGKVTLELRPRNSTALSSTIDLEVIPLPETTGTEKGNQQTPNIVPVFVSPEEEFFRERNWDALSVAEVDANDEEVTVFVSSGNKHLSALIAKAQRQNTQAVDEIKNFYLEHMAFHAVIADIDRRAAESETEDPEMIGKQFDGELRHACETVCGIIASLFDVLIVPTAESQKSEDNQ